jgi:thiol-disulfide isomerase/thioredoxin
VSFVPVLNRRSAMFCAPALLGATLLAPGLSRQGWAAKGLEKLREAANPAPPPTITFTDADGKETTLADFAGQGLVINLWATWCPPCVAEMPALDRLQAMLRAERIAVLALSSDRGGRAQVEPFYQRLGLKELAIWLDPRGAAARALGARGLPTTVIIDRAGREVARLEGEAAWDAPELVAAVRRLVGAP